MKKYWLLVVTICFCWHIVIARQEPAFRKTIPIMAWAKIPASETNLERFLELREMGITICLNTYPDFDSMHKALHLAGEAGLQMVASCPELKSDTENTVRKVIDHPALAGHFLKDEPVRKDFTELGELARKIAGIDPRHFAFVNLMACIHPTLTEALGTTSYTDYVKTFLREVPVILLSFDFYPILKDDIHERWYEGLEIFSAEARKAGKPFFAFALASSDNELHPIPTTAALRLQMYSNLAYGAQGIEYWSFRGYGAPLDGRGKRTVVYDRVQTISNEIQNLSGIFLGAKLVSVAHTGLNIPDNTSRLEKLPNPISLLETIGEGAVVSVLTNGGNTFLVIVNRDFQKTMKLILRTDPTVKRVLKNGRLIPAVEYAHAGEVEPGDAVIYTFPTK